MSIDADAEQQGTEARAGAGVAADPDALRGRVLFLCPQPFFEWRGSPIRVGFDVRALTELGFGVDLLVMPVGADREIPGVRLFRAPNLLRVRSLPIGPSAAKAVLDIGLFFRAWGLIRRQRYVAIHGVEETGALAVILARMARCRCIFEKHSDPGSYRRGRLRNLVMAAYARVEAFTIRRADAIIGTGPGLVEQARRLSPRGSVHHIFDIPSSLEEADPARVAAARARLLGPGEGPLVMYVGSFAVYQGVDLMFGSLPRVVRAAPQTRVAIVGGSAEEIACAQARLAREGAAGAVQFLGMIPPDELPHLLAAADILLSPRISGTNTPLKLLDYLKAGGAVVACDTPANRLLLDEETAVLAAPSPEAFADGILRLARDAPLRRRLSEAGRRRLRERYSYEEFKRRLGRCYAAALAD